MTIGLAIMRLQPLHIGHKKLIDIMLSKHEKSYLLVGSANVVDDDRNPFSYSERKNMVEMIYSTEINLEKLVVLPINDIGNPPKWVAHVLANIPVCPDCYYCGTNQDKNLFEDRGIKTQEINRAELPISATQIRKMIIEKDEKWQNYVPKEIVELVGNKFL